MGDTSIQWTEKTWNPLRGCSVVSPGCINCYAMKQAHRFSGAGGAYEGLTKLTARSGPQWTGKVVLVEDHLLDPLEWNKPRRVFVNSMSDLFHEDVPDAWIDQVFNVMAYSPQHTFQVLTKRSDRMHRYLSSEGRPDAVFEAIYDAQIAERRGKAADDLICRGMDRVKFDGVFRMKWPLPNVWLGVSVEDQKHADERIPQLLQTPAAIRFISAEPLLGPIRLRWNLVHDQGERLHWVIVGGESGPGARLFDITFARAIVKQCADAGVACFVKQLGARPEQPTLGAWNSAHRESLLLRDRKGGDMNEWPADLRVRQFPKESK